MNAKEILDRVISKTASKTQGLRGGRLGEMIEERTTRMSSRSFLVGALGIIGAAALLRLIGSRTLSLFVGQLAAPALLMGLWNRIKSVAPEKLSFSKR